LVISLAFAGCAGMADTIEPGKSADFIVINQNLLKIPPQKIHETKVLQTVLKGHTVYEGK
jgi:hypothetical protein